MQTHYAPLFKLDVSHDYFPDSQCPAVRISSSEETSSTMQQLGIRMVTRAYGIECFYNDGAPPAGQLLQLNDPVRLSFLLRTDDPLFLNYTQLPGSPSVKSIQYFTNLHAPEASVNLPASRATTLPARRAVFTVKARNPAERISLRDELGNILYTWSPELASEPSVIQSANEEATEFRLNLSQEAPGRYVLHEGDSTLLDFVLLPRNWQEGDLGLFSVYVGDTGASGPHLLEGGVVTPAGYTIEFSARATTWRYHLIDSGEPGHEGFQLLDHAGNEVVAEVAVPPLTRMLPDGSLAVILTAPQPLPLRRQPGQRFTLHMIRKGSGRSAPITVPLPSANASRLSRGQPTSAGAAENEVFYSDLYVYL